MIPCLHQSKVYMKRKLRVLRAAKRIPPSMCLQTTGSHAAPTRADNGNLRKFGATFRHGTMFAPKESSYEKEATGMESLKM